MRDWSFFDCNAMVGNTLVPPLAPVVNAGELLKAMDYFGIEQALFYHNGESKEEIERLTKDSAQKSKRLMPCGVLPLGPTLVQERIESHVDRMLAAGMKAMRLIPDEGPSAAPMTLRVHALAETLERLNQHRVPLMLAAEHFQLPQAVYTYGYDEIDAICRQFPQIPVILLQPRYAAQTPLIALMRRHANVHFTIPWFGLFRQVENIVKIFGPERLLFGTNLPHIDPALPIGMVNYGLLSSQDKKMIAGENLRRLLGGVR